MHLFFPFSLLSFSTTISVPFYLFFTFIFFILFLPLTHYRNDSLGLERKNGGKEEEEEENKVFKREKQIGIGSIEIGKEKNE